MRKILWLAALTIVHFGARADLGESFVCPKDNYDYKGVTCCLRALSPEQCRKIVDESIPTHMQNAIKLVQNNKNNNIYQYAEVPNCFWSALTYFKFDLDIEPKLIQPYTFTDHLTAKFKQKESLDAGDLVVFVMDGQAREDLVAPSGAPIKKWFPYSSVEHGAISLGNGLIFQKENVGTGIFSIDLLTESLKAYEKAFNKNPQYRGKMKAESWSLR